MDYSKTLIPNLIMLGDSVIKMWKCLPAIATAEAGEKVVFRTTLISLSLLSADRQARSSFSFPRYV
jgi:hypothetical protein